MPHESCLASWVSQGNDLTRPIDAFTVNIKDWNLNSLFGDIFKNTKILIWLKA